MQETKQKLLALADKCACRATEVSSEGDRMQLLQIATQLKQLAAGTGNRGVGGEEYSVQRNGRAAGEEAKLLNAQ
jgi:hypothetical protein